MDAKKRDFVWAFVSLVIVIASPLAVAFVSASFQKGTVAAFWGLVVSCLVWRVFVYPQIMKEEEEFERKTRGAHVASLYP
ncbi:MAG TPA: hypothetical protein PKA31_03985 [Candidatus Moranbacteria bacterium]|nr:hypothetical protein [Candidatus Moranbacteria bacterium]